MKKITDINEVHHLLLDIAKAFDSICRKNNIPYFMLGGTMLGAVRHKGFIPWDDDMDFGVPRDYFNTLIKKLEQELPAQYKICTYKNGRTATAFLKINDERTTISEFYNYDCDLGVNIDIFPLDYCAPSNIALKRVRLLMIINASKFSENPHWGFFRKLLNSVIRLLIPWSTTTINRKIENILSSCKDKGYFTNVMGAWGEKECIRVEWYGSGENFKFEDTEFLGIKEYDKYLTKLYGDYMTPPTNNHIHIGEAFFK